MAEEVIEGAPAPLSPAEERERRLRERISLNQYVYRQSQQYTLMLLAAPTLRKLLDVLLVSTARHFGFSIAELWLHDPDGVITELVPHGHTYGNHLQLHSHVFDMQELYDPEPDIALVDAKDPRMFEILKSDQGIDYAVLFPLMDSGRLIGSFHCGAKNLDTFNTAAEEELLAHVAAVISVCYRNVVSTERVSALAMLDPLTRISNPRGFEVDIAREIARAQRAAEPVSLLLINIDEYADIYTHYGNAAGDFVVKKVTERVSSDLRATDHLARLDGGQMAVIVPGCGEVRSREIAERMRGDTEDLPIDDGRGAILHVTLSIGLVTWEPQQYPAVDMRQLAAQMRAAADTAVAHARSESGNRVSVGRLTTLPL
jgi:diguanylate cyclase (GGDEF)-like protein